MNIKIEVDDFEIINSGSIIVENKQVVNFNFKDSGLDLNFKIKFTEDENISESKFELNVNKENNYLEINIINTGYGLTQITQLKFFEISLWGNPKFRRTIFCVFW